MGAGVSFRFAHAFFRQTLYEEMFAPRRIRLHQQVDRALEDVHVDRLREHAAEMAEHFTQSTDREDLQKALEYGIMAVERSIAVYAYGEASRLLEQALQVQEVLDPDDKATRCDLLLTLGDALMPAGEPRRVMDAVAPEAFTLAETIADRARASRACRVGLDALRRYGGAAMMGAPVHRQWAERSDQYAEPGTSDRVFADLALWAVKGLRGNFTEARALKVRALELARKLDDPEALLWAATAFLIAPPVQDEKERWRLVQEMAAHPHVGVAPRHVGEWLEFSAATHMEWGDRAGAEGIWEEMNQLAERTNDANLILKSLEAPVRSALLDGRLEVAVSAAEHILERAEELGAPVHGKSLATGTSFRPLLYLGRGDEAMAAMGEIQQLRGANISLQEWLSVMLRAHMGPLDEAEDGLRRLMPKYDLVLQDENTPTILLVIFFGTAVLIEDRELCSVLAQRLAPAAFMSDTFNVWTCPARQLGAAAALLGEPDRARKYYHQALEAAGKIRFRPEIALTRLQLCELLLEHYPDERSEALEHLDFAIGEFRDMKMQPSLERALSHRDILRA